MPPVPSLKDNKCAAVRFFSISRDLTVSKVDLRSGKKCLSANKDLHVAEQLQCSPLSSFLGHTWLGAELANEMHGESSERDIANGLQSLQRTCKWNESL